MVRHSGIHGYGLYTMEAVSKGSALGVWTGVKMSNSEWQDDRYGLELRYDEQNVVVVTPVDNGTVDFSKHPFAAMNEPPPNSTSNVYMRVEEYDDAGVTYLMAVFYAAVDIAENCELWWHYGNHYQRNYAVGIASAFSDDPPLRFERFLGVLHERPDGVYRPNIDNDTSSGEDWREPFSR